MHYNTSSYVRAKFVPKARVTTLTLFYNGVLIRSEQKKKGKTFNYYYCFYTYNSGSGRRKKNNLNRTQRFFRLFPLPPHIDNCLK